MRRLARHALTFSLGLASAACGGGPAPATTTPAAQAACDPDHLDACERSIAEAVAARKPLRELVARYAAARVAADARDPWGEIHRAMTAAAPKTGAPPAILVVEGSADAALAAAKRLDAATLRAIPVPSLPAPKAIAPDVLLLALGEAAGADLVLHAGGAGAVAIFPRDPLEPFVVGLAPIARAGGAPARLAEEIALARSVRAALAAASAFDYVAAAREGAALAAQVAAAPPEAETTLRGRYALQLLGAAGIALEPEGERAAASSARAPIVAGATDPGAPPPPAPGDTPYGDYLRVRTAKSERDAFAARRETILGAVPADRREALAALFAPPGGCASPAPAPTIAEVRDLQLGARLSAALARPDAPGPEPGRIALPEWLPRYEALVRLVDATRSAWAYAPTLLYQRGDVAGLSASGSPTYQRVTELGLSHMAALRKLEQAFPTRYRALSQLSLVYSPGVLGDDRLREQLVLLTQATVQDKLARAEDAAGVFEGTLAGVFAGMSYPPAIQSAHYLALQGAFTAKLRGDLTRRTGWGVAGLYAAEAIFRALSDQAPNLRFSAGQIARALGDPGLEQRSLGALAVSAAGYAALAADKKLDLNQKPENFHPERRTAREALKRALAGLAVEGEAAPPASVLEDVTHLADGIIAAAAWSAADERPAPAGACPARAASAPPPELIRALGKLGDVRRRVLLHPAYKKPATAWMRRARLLVTVLSDAIDVMMRKGSAPPRFAIPRRDAEEAVATALADWDERALAEALAGAYGLAREGMTATSADAFVAANGQNLRRVLGGLSRFFGEGDGAAKGKGGVALLDALASVASSGRGLEEQDASALLLDYAGRFYAEGKKDQGDLFLLAVLTVSATTHRAPPAAAIDLAGKNASRVGWVLRFLSELQASRRGVAPDPAAFAADMRAATDDQCARPDAEPVLAALGAVRDFAGGKRREARASLDRVLDAAEERGLTIPKMALKYEERTATRVFTYSLDLSYGAGLLEGANGMQLGLGLKTPGEPGGSLAVSFASSDGTQAGEEAARWFAHTAALAAAYHFLDGDVDRGQRDARRAVSAVVNGVRLGARAVKPDGARWGADARAVLAVDAQLAAEAGRVFVAGDLWTIVRATLPPEAGDREIAELLDPRPLGLAAVPDAAPVLGRAARSLSLVAEPLPCTEAKVEPPPEEQACDGYPLALSLRIADVMKKLPHLRRGAEAGAKRCGPMRALDTFLTAADKGTYDPDAFSRAVLELRADGRVDDAAVLLTRHRKESHCNPAMVATARALGRDASLGHALRTDLLSLAVNCSAAGLDQAVADDLLALDAETRRFADPTRNFHLMLFVADAAGRAGRWDVLERLAAEPGFVDRWLSQSPVAAAAALVVDHAATLLAGHTIDPARTRGTYDLVCRTLPPQSYRELCDHLGALRGLTKESAAERARLARKALESVTAAVAAPAPHP